MAIMWNSKFIRNGGFIVLALLLGCSIILIRAKNDRAAIEETKVAVELDLAVAWVEARDFYKAQNYQSAVSAFEKYLQLADTPRVQQTELPKRLRFFRFTAHAYLAKVHKAIGNEDAYRWHLAEAKKLGIEFHQPMNDEGDVFEMLDRLGKKPSK